MVWAGITPPIVARVPSDLSSPGIVGAPGSRRLGARAARGRRRISAPGRRWSGRCGSNGDPAAMAVFVLVGLRRGTAAAHPAMGRGDLGVRPARLAIMLTLYAVWRLANRLSLMQVDGAIWRGHWLWDLQRTWRLPSEVTVQQMVLPHPLLVQLANVFYAVAHVPAMIIFLVWLFASHRPRYPQIRGTRWPSPPARACSSSSSRLPRPAHPRARRGRHAAALPPVRLRRHRHRHCRAALGDALGPRRLGAARRHRQR